MHQGPKINWSDIPQVEFLTGEAYVAYRDPAGHYHDEFSVSSTPVFCMKLTVTIILLWP